MPTTQEEATAVIHVLGTLCHLGMDVITKVTVDTLVLPSSRSAVEWFLRESVLRDSRICPQNITFDMDDVSAVLAMSYRHLVRDPLFINMAPLESITVSRFMQSNAFDNDDVVTCSNNALFANIAASLRARTVRIDAPFLWTTSVASSLSTNTGAENVCVDTTVSSDRDLHNLGRFCACIAEQSTNRASMIVSWSEKNVHYVRAHVSTDANMSYAVSIDNPPPYDVTFAAGGTSLLGAMRHARLPNASLLTITGRIRDNDVTGPKTAYLAGTTLMRNTPQLCELNLHVTGTMRNALDLVWGIADGSARCRSLKTVNVSITCTSGTLDRQWTHEIALATVASSICIRDNPKWSVTLFNPLNLVTVGTQEEESEGLNELAELAATV